MILPTMNSWNARMQENVTEILGLVNATVDTRYLRYISFLRNCDA